MPAKQYTLEGFGVVTVTKRRASRSIKLRLKPDGSAAVSVPLYTPYAMGFAFAKKQKGWLLKQSGHSQGELIHAQSIGKMHTLALIPTQGASSCRTLVSKSTVTVRYPVAYAADDARVQSAARKACERALLRQAEQLLPDRVAHLANTHSFSYKSLNFKKVTSRWGSCDKEHNITLNIYLLQLPWDCIDYVILHELTHTRIFAHGEPFWTELANYVPRLPAMRKRMRGYRPVLYSAQRPVQ